MNRLTQICLAACISLISAVWAQPLEFTVQGRLLDDQGVPVSDPTGVFLSLHASGEADTADSGTLLYKEQADVTPDATGIFNHALGTGTPLDTSTLDLSDFQQPGDLWVQIAVGTQGNVLLPRMAVNSAPWAVQSLEAQNADTLDGESGSHYLDLTNHTGAVDAASLPELAGSIWLPARVFEGNQQIDPGEIWSLGNLPVIVFPSGGQSKATTSVSFPSDFAPGPLRYTLVFAGDETPLVGSADVSWTLRATSLLDVDSASISGLIGTVGLADDVVNLTATSSITLDNGGAVAVQVFRNGVAAGDTYGGDVEVLGLRIDYNTDPEAF